MKLDFKKLGLKCGIEIHQQLNTKRKLFCNCRADFSDKEKYMQLTRKQRAVAGELGDIDAAAAHEFLAGKEFFYSVYPNESCLVETDSEPPHNLNTEALEIALEIALMLNCDIPDEVQIMRKTVIDGSNTSGFQRTAIVGINGFVETSFGRVGIDLVSLEEESSQIIKREKSRMFFGLNRLGIPLVEIGTSPDIKTPEQAREAAEKIGAVLHSTNVKKGLGTIRQDLNVSIKGGARNEIKGVQSLSIIPKAVETEALRQKSLLDRGKKVSRDVRRCLPDGRTEFMRPLPGAARLYPETDLPPIEISRKTVDFIRKSLPEHIGDKSKRFAKQYKLGNEILSQLMASGKTELFEKIVKSGTNAKIAAVVLTATMKTLKRQGAPVDDLKDADLIEMFKALKSGKISRDNIPKVMEKMAKKQALDGILKKLDAKSMSDDELRKLIRKVISQNPGAMKTPRPEKALMGLVMKEVKGRASGSLVMRILAEEIGKG